MTLAFGPVALASKVQALILTLTAALTIIFWYHLQTPGVPTTDKVRLKVCGGQQYSTD